MKASSILPLFLTAIAMHGSTSWCLPHFCAGKSGNKLRAMIYRGKSSCDGCPESVQNLLETAYPNINVVFAGPREKTRIDAETLSQVDIFVQPGGSDLDRAWREAKSYATDMRTFVASGGLYLGFCLGAFLAGPHRGFGLLPEGDKIMREISRPKAQVNDINDTIIQVDWMFSTGKKIGTTDHKRWLYFQDGAAFVLSEGSPTIVLGRYSRNGDVASTLNAYGRGWVANIGPHPEADQSWYDDAEVSNSEGVRDDIGVDFVKTAIDHMLKGSQHRKRAEIEDLRDLIFADYE